MAPGRRTLSLPPSLHMNERRGKNREISFQDNRKRCLKPKFNIKAAFLNQARVPNIVKSGRGTTLEWTELTQEEQ